jgi:hypothetical protein
MGDLTDKILLKLISGLHIIFICFVLIAPFLNSNYILFIHSIIMPFIMMHWLLNNNMCALTLLETKMREKMTGIVNAKKECISCKIIEPIYKNYKSTPSKTKAITGPTFIISKVTSKACCPRRETILPIFS